MSVGETPSTLTRWRSTNAHSRSGPGTSGAPSYNTSVPPLASVPTISHGPMIQPMSVSQNSRSPARRSIWNATSSAIFTRNPRVHVHRTLGPAGRAARVRHEQRMLTVDRLGVEAVGLIAHQIAEHHVAAGRHRQRRARSSRGTTTTVCTESTCATAWSAVSFISTVLPRRVKPSAVINATAPASSRRTATASAP